jgi:hypothetical protein
MRDATLPLRTVTATTLLCFWQGRNKILQLKYFRRQKGVALKTAKAEICFRIFYSPLPKT